MDRSIFTTGNQNTSTKCRYFGNIRLRKRLHRLRASDMKGWWLEKCLCTLAWQGWWLACARGCTWVAQSTRIPRGLLKPNSKWEIYYFQVELNPFYHSSRSCMIGAALTYLVCKQRKAVKCYSTHMTCWTPALARPLLWPPYFSRPKFFSRTLRIWWEKWPT